jgi:hypothetical protein
MIALKPRCSELALQPLELARLFTLITTLTRL